MQFVYEENKWNQRNKVALMTEWFRKLPLDPLQDCNNKIKDFITVHRYWFNTFSQTATFSVTYAVFKWLLKIGQCKMQTADWLWTIVFRVEKQWGYRCHVLICMVKTIVCSLYFPLTAAEIHLDWTFYCFKIISVNWAFKSSWTLAILVKNELFCHSWSNLEW